MEFWLMYEAVYALHFCGPLFVSLLVEIRFIIIEESFGKRMTFVFHSCGYCTCKSCWFIENQYRLWIIRWSNSVQFWELQNYQGISESSWILIQCHFCLSKFVCQNLLSTHHHWVGPLTVYCMWQCCDYFLEVECFFLLTQTIGILNLTKAETDEMGRKKTGRNICCHNKYLGIFTHMKGYSYWMVEQVYVPSVVYAQFFLRGSKWEGLGVEGKFVSFSMILGGEKLSELFLGD